MQPIQIDLSAEQTEAFDYLEDDETNLVLYGGAAGCFTAGTLIHTLEGEKRIEDVQPGDLIETYNHKKKCCELKPCVKAIKHETTNERIIRIKLKDGTQIEATENHKFFYGGSYVKIKDILLTLGYELENNTQLQQVRSL